MQDGGIDSMVKGHKREDARAFARDAVRLGDFVYYRGSRGAGGGKSQITR